MEELPEKLLLITDILEADKEEAMVVEAKVEEATEESQREEEISRVGTKHSQPSNGPSVSFITTEEAAIGPTLVREYMSAACAWAQGRPACKNTPTQNIEADMGQEMEGGVEI